VRGGFPLLAGSLRLNALVVPVPSTKPTCRATAAMIRLPQVTKAELLGAIREGVHDAIWGMITNATMAPSADFYAAVEDGVAEGVRQASNDVAPVDGLLTSTFSGQPPAQTNR
jgi:hypothetical protein